MLQHRSLANSGNSADIRGHAPTDHYTSPDHYMWPLLITGLRQYGTMCTTDHCTGLSNWCLCIVAKYPYRTIIQVSYQVVSELQEALNALLVNWSHCLDQWIETLNCNSAQWQVQIYRSVLCTVASKEVSTSLHLCSHNLWSELRRECFNFLFHKVIDSNVLMHVMAKYTMQWHYITILCIVTREEAR